ncbi:hypothetical protein AAVH_27552 [Aphelenchoides avenae]|nr:hypothetical protein AAVH_27552 [Aphelenchus avenae]
MQRRYRFQSSSVSARRLYDRASRAVEAALEQEVRQLTNENRHLTEELAEERAQRENLGKLKIVRTRRKTLRGELDAQRSECAQALAMLTVANAKLKVETDLYENLRAELAKKLDNCGKLTSELDAERTKSADLEDQLKLLRDKGL